MKQQHHPQDEKTYTKGINSDTNKELLGLSDGEHVDALNMRSLSQDGDNGAKKKIKGEELLYPAIDNRCFLEIPGTLDDSYECMLTLEIQGHVIECWASSEEANDPFIRVNGKIVAMSEDLPIDLDHPLQYDKNENCVGGEIYITNNNTPPIVLSLKDMMQNSGIEYKGQTIGCTQKYFGEFNIDEFTVNITSAFHKPLFIKQDSSTSGYNKVFGATGLAVGSYSYSYRYVSPDGDRSNWSPITELIPVTSSIGLSDDYFPARRTYSKDPNIASPSVYGNHVRFRIENFNNFDFIEVRRDSWYSGDPVGSPPVSEIIGLLDIVEGVYAVNILDKCAPDETEEVITLDEQSNQMSSIQRAKAIRYYNERLYLMNIAYASKDIDEAVDFTDPVSTLFPTIQKLGKLGHKSAFNATHYKADMRGDVKGYGVAVWDGNGNISFVKKIPGFESFHLPNRRDVASSLTLGTSYLGTVRAANVNGGVTQTHEVFDHKNAKQRSGLVEANILDQFVFDKPWAPFNPVSDTDDDSDYGRQVNYLINVAHDVTGSIELPYNPKGFGLDYYSMGVALKGVDLPSWATGFSVVQTESVKKVVAQGLGFYDLQEAESTFGQNGTKGAASIIVYFPDLDESTGLSPEIMDDLLAGNVSSYNIQAVSPLGYFSEVYSFEHGVQRNKGTDLITYCRILNDNGEINPTGCDGITSAGTNYVAYGSFMGNTNPAVFNGNANGNNLFEIDSVEEVTTKSSIGKYFRIHLDGTFPIYALSGAGGNIDSHEQSVKNWQEPVYVVNLVKKGVEVVDANTTQYKYTGHFVKNKALVATGTGSNITVPLVSERWEDCIQTVSIHIANDYSALERFVWVEDAFGEPKRWLNVTNKSVSDINTILTDIQTNGFHTITDASGSFSVYGVYKSEDVIIGQDTYQRGFNLKFESFANFNNDLMVPAQDRKVYVYYDNRIPVRVFGGDTYINESIWALTDNIYNKNAEPIDEANEFRWNMPMPYNRYQISPEINIVRNTQGINKVQDERTFNFQRSVTPSWIRQWVTMWTAETRINLSFAFNDPVAISFDQYFPLKNYVMHPYRWDDSEFGAADPSDVYTDNNIKDPEYKDVYGAEYFNWGYGGFRFRPQTNLDYSKSQTTLLLTSTPQLGFDEQTEFCTRAIWSEKRPINAQNTPTVRTFPAGNFYDLSDDTDEIKFAWSAISSDKGTNLYALTDSGIALLLVDKRIIHEINADELATVGSDIGGILNHLWIDRNIGMHDETWRSWAEYSNMLWFHNGVSAYVFSDNNLVPITDNGWKEIYLNRIAPYIQPGYGSKLCGVYNVLNKEYIMNFDKSQVPKDSKYDLVPQSAIYGATQEALQCRSTYNYDKYLAIGNKLYGMKDAETYLLGVGNQLDGEDMECFVAGVSDKEIFFDKEFIRIRVNSTTKPERIEFYSSYDDYLNNLPSSTVDANASPVAIKNYFGFECYIPRKEVAPHYRQQGRYVIFKIVSSADENFTVASTLVQYKQLK